MNNEALLTAFFQAENQRDWKTYKTFLHPEVQWSLFSQSEEQIVGIKGYLQAMQQAYERTAVQFVCQEMQISDDGNRIVTHLINDFGKRSIDIFDFKDGLIYREYEFILG